MPQSSLNALIAAYQAQSDWLIVQAEEFETGQRKVFGKVGGQDVDISSSYAAEYRHKAGNMQAIMQAYERLHAQGA
jgi:hypothetical protein